MEKNRIENLIEGLPALPGSYALWLTLASPLEIHYGHSAGGAFPAGEYAYLGSAHGPGGLRARMGRHLRAAGRPHWHIDALRASALLHGFWYVTEPGRLPVPLECLWSQALAALPAARLPAPGFGASDCRAGCPAHLVWLPPGSAPILAQMLSQSLLDCASDLIDYSLSASAGKEGKTGQPAAV